MSSKSQMKYYEIVDQNFDTNKLPSSPSVPPQKEYLCFANIQNIRKKASSIHRNTCCHHSPRALKNEKSSNKQNVKSPYREHEKKIKDVFEQQNKSLRRTIETLKDQIQSLEENYIFLKDKNKKMRRQFQQREAMTKKKIQDYERMEKKCHEFDELMPRIEELEVLQDKVLEENKVLKKNQGNLKEILSNILVIVGNSNNQTLSSIRNLIRKKIPA